MHNVMFLGSSDVSGVRETAMGTGTKVWGREINRIGKVEHRKCKPDHEFCPEISCRGKIESAIFNRRSTAQRQVRSTDRGEEA